MAMARRVRANPNTTSHIRPIGRTSVQSPNPRTAVPIALSRCPHRDLGKHQTSVISNLLFCVAIVAIVTFADSLILLPTWVRTSVWSRMELEWIRIECHSISLFGSEVGGIRVMQHHCGQNFTTPINSFSVTSRLLPSTTLLDRISVSFSIVKWLEWFR